MSVIVPMEIKVPVKIDVDGFKFCNEHIPKGGIFNCPTQYRADWMETQGTGHKMKRGKSNLTPVSEGSWQLVPARKAGRPGKYSTRVMTAEDEAPVRFDDSTVEGAADGSPDEV